MILITALIRSLNAFIRRISKCPLFNSCLVIIVHYINDANLMNTINNANNFILTNKKRRDVKLSLLVKFL